MGELRLTQMFRGTTRQSGPLPVEVVLPQVKKLVRQLGQAPAWLVHGGFTGDKTGRYPEIGYDSERGLGKGFIEESNRIGNGDNGVARRSVQLEEKKKSSRIRILNLVGVPESGGAIFRPFAKLKERQQIRALWEYVMLDTWSRVLQAYSRQNPFRLTAPRPLSIIPATGQGEKDVSFTWLMMTHCKGVIVNKLHFFELPRTLTMTDKNVYAFNQALSIHLGRLARIKEAEGLIHGDADLRHLLFNYGCPLQLKAGQIKRTPTEVLPSLVSILGLAFDDGRMRPADREEQLAYYDQTDPEVRYVVASDGTTAVAVEIKPVRLSVIDVEKSYVEEDERKVQQENERLWSQFLKANGNRQGTNQRAYEDGYNSVKPLLILPQVERAQQLAFGFSFDHLFSTLS